MLLFAVTIASALEKSTGLVGIKVLPLPDSRVRMLFQFDASLREKPTAFTMNFPAKLVLDFKQIKNEMPQDKSRQTVSVGALKSFTVVEADKRLRAILDLSQVVAYKMQIQGKNLSLTLEGPFKQSFYRSKEVFYANHQQTKAKHRINDVDFRGSGKNAGKLILRISDPNMNVDVNQRGAKVYVKLFNTKIPGHLIRRLDVGDFHTPAKTVDSYQKGKNAQFVISTKGDFGHFAYQVDKDFVVEVFPLTPEEITRAKLKKEVFTGKRISLNFQNISVRAVLQLLADFTKKNLVVSDGVTGNITLRLSQIPWDQALSIILKTRGLVKRQMGEVMLIAPSSEITSREKQELAQIQQSKALSPLLSELIQINYAKASDIAALINNKANSMLSKRGRLSVDARTNSIWLQDTAINLDEVKDLIVKLDVPVRQVLIEARIVIVNKDIEENLGIRWGFSRPTSVSGTLEGANAMQGGTAAADVPLSQRLNVDLAAPLTTGTAATFGLALAQLGEGVLLDLELSALESEGKGEVISSPRLITANQQAASIEAGEEIPYQEAASSGATTIAFKKAVLSLMVTPQITPDNKIILDLAVNQDQPSAQRFNGVPAILTKQIETNVLVNNGQTIVLGGIYKQDTKEAVNRIPFLGSLPIVGALFRNKQNVVKREELLIFITPKIIRHSFMTS